MRPASFFLALLAALILAVFERSYSDEPLDAEQKAAILIAEMSQTVCGGYVGEGGSRKYTIEGEADAGLKLLSKKLLDLGIEGGGRLDDQSYKNLFREDLAKEFQDVRRCRERVFDKMFERVFGSPSSEILSDERGEIIEGEVEPHGMEVIQRGANFMMKLHDSVGLGSPLVIFSIDKVGVSNNKRYVNYSWSNLQDGTSASRYAYQGGAIMISGDCKVVPHKVDVEKQSVSFISGC